MKYKVQNRLNSYLNLGDLRFEPKETKILDFKPYSDKFIVEKIEEQKEMKSLKGGNK